MDNTNANETPLFGKKPQVAEPVAAPVTATPAAAPAAPTAKKTSVGLIIGAIITAAAFIAASVVLVIVLITRQPNTSSKKSDESSEEKKEEEKKPTPSEDEDEDEDKDDDEDESEDETEDNDVEDHRDELTITGEKSFTLGVQGKSFKFSNDYVKTVKNALNAGYEMTYQDIEYKDHALTKSNLDSYLDSEMANSTKSYRSAEVSIVDGNGDTVLSINGTKDYSKGLPQKYSDAKFDTISYSSTLELTLPNGKKISCHNTTKQDIFDIYGETEVSSLDIIRYHKDGLNISFHLDKENTVTSVYIRLD